MGIGGRRMITLQKITKSYGKGRRQKRVLIDVNLDLHGNPGGFGILGAKQSGKTTLLQIVSGLMTPDSGVIRRSVFYSWPIAWRGFGRDVTGDEQVALLARMYRRDRRGLLRYVVELSGLDAKIYQPMSTYSPREKDRLMQAAAFGIDFDVYLVDEAVPGVEKTFAPRYDSLVQEILRSGRFILFSSSPSNVAAHCRSGVLLSDGVLSNIASPHELENAFRQSFFNASKSK